MASAIANMEALKGLYDQLKTRMDKTVEEARERTQHGCDERLADPARGRRRARTRGGSRDRAAPPPSASADSACPPAVKEGGRRGTASSCRAECATNSA